MAPSISETINSAKSALPETIDILPAEESIQFHEPVIQNRMINRHPSIEKANSGGNVFTKYSTVGTVIAVGIMILIFAVLVFVRIYRPPASKKNILPKEKDKPKDNEKTERKKKEKKKKEKKRRSSRETNKRKRKSKSSTSVPSSTISSSSVESDSSANIKSKKRKIKKPKNKSENQVREKDKEKDSQTKEYEQVKMVPLTERHPTKVSLRALNRQLNARIFFEDKLKTLRDGSERERMLKALREMQVTTRWPEMKTEDISTESINDVLPKHERTALSPFINFQRPRLMAKPASISRVTTRIRSQMSSHSQGGNVSYYRYKETELKPKNLSEERQHLVQLQQQTVEPVVFMPARIQSKITTKALEEYFSLEKLSQWQKDEEPEDSSDSSSDSLKLSGAGRRISDDQSFVMYSRDANPRRIRDHSILNARPTPPETIDDKTSPPTPAHVRKTLAARIQSRTVRFDRFTKRYFV